MLFAESGSPFLPLAEFLRTYSEATSGGVPSAIAIQRNPCELDVPVFAKIPQNMSDIPKLIDILISEASESEIWIVCALLLARHFGSWLRAYEFIGHGLASISRMSDHSRNSDITTILLREGVFFKAVALRHLGRSSDDFECARRLLDSIADENAPNVIVARGEAEKLSLQLNVINHEIFVGTDGVRSQGIRFESATENRLYDIMAAYLELSNKLENEEVSTDLRMVGTLHRLRHRVLPRVRRQIVTNSLYIFSMLFINGSEIPDVLYSGAVAMRRELGQVSPEQPYVEELVGRLFDLLVGTPRALNMLYEFKSYLESLIGLKSQHSNLVFLRFEMRKFEWILSWIEQEIGKA